jgi:hypothetical protein
MKLFLTGLLILTSLCTNAQNWGIPDYTNLYTPKPIVYPTLINHNHYCENSNQYIANGRDLLIGDIIDGLISSIVRVSKNKKRKRINKTRRTRKLRSININRSYTYSR